MNLLNSLLFASCVLFLSSDVANGKRLPMVTVQKCCRLGEMLQQIDSGDSSGSPDPEDDLQCIPGLGENWLPQIYAPARKVFLNSKIVPANWQLKELSRPFCGYGVRPKLVHLAVPYLNYYMLANGSLFVEEHHVLYDPKDFCIDKLSAMVCDFESAANVTEQVEAYVDARAVKKKIKIRKCCGEGGAYSRDNSTCVVVSGPLGHSGSFEVQLEDPSNATVTFVSGFPTCKIGHFGFAINALPSSLVKIRNDGSLDLQGNRTTDHPLKNMPPSAFCVERALPHNYQELQKRLTAPANAVIYNDVSDGGVDPEIRTKITSRDLSEINNNNLLIRDDLHKVHVFSCIQDAPDMEKKPLDAYDELRYTIYPISLALSVVFLLATLAVGFLVPGNHHALHWRCQTYYVTCLLFGDTLLSISQLAGRDLGAKTCMSVAILMHFFFLAAFFWLNTMCFNIWWTFRDFRPSSLEKGQESCRLRAYAAYAWGGPLLIAGCAALLDNVPQSSSGTGAPAVLRPRFGEERCWFSGEIEILTYFYGPIGLLLFVNLLLFTSTARQLTCGLWKREEVKSTTERAALGRVCMKLVVVMGVTWIADVISWGVGGPHYLWYATDMINALQGVLIFIVVGCQPQVWAALKRLYADHCCHRSTSNPNAPQNSSSSVGGLPSIGDSVTHNTTANVTTNKIPMETVC